MDVKGQVSVIIPVFNRDKILNRSVESVLRQDYTNYELIIVDDGSTDHTKEIVEEYMRRDPRIKLFNNTNAKGPAGARNTGLQKATGEYVAFLDSDDEWIPSHLSDSIIIMETKEVEACIGLWDEKSPEGERYPRWTEGENKKKLEKLLNDLKPECMDKYVLFDSRFVEYLILSRFYCYSINTLVFKKEKLNKCGFFNEDLRASEDVDFTLRLFDISKVCLIRTCQFIYHQGTDNLYYFMDRKKLELKEIVNNKELILRMVYCDLHKIKMFKLRKNFVLESKTIKNKKKCRKECDYRIAKKYFTLGVLFHRLRPAYACRNVMLSMRYEFKLYKIIYLYYICFNKKKCLNVENDKIQYT
jgi:glycosyltransferase involved in cell wall biosynthesis